MRDEKRVGIIISYINIVLSMGINLILTPMLITALSDEGYSIYKVMHSMAAPLGVLNMGVSSVVSRSIARYKVTAGEDKREKENTLFYAMLISGCMAITVLCVGFFTCGLIPSVYRETYSDEALIYAKKIFSVFVTTTAVHVASDSFRGCVAGNEKFLFYYGIHTVQYVLRFALIIVLLKAGYGALMVAVVDLIIALLQFVCYSSYSVVHLGERPRRHAWNTEEFKAILSFSVAIFLQAVINQVNNNLDILILGAFVVEKRIITMYSSALTIYGIYNSLISVFAGVYLPKATRAVTKGATGEELTDLVILPGRYQAMLAVCVIFGFAFLGKDFIELWIGMDYTDAYYVALALMIPVTIPLVQNVCLSILDAQLKRLFRSVTLALMALINVILSIVLVQKFGFWGAALGTVISLTVGHIIIMNVYYKNVIGLNVSRVFRSIFQGTLWAGLLAYIICVPVSKVMENTITSFLIKGMVFVCLYVVLLWKMSLSANEKREVCEAFSKFRSIG